MDPSDGELVTLARSGDTAALAVLLARHRSAMHAVAVARLGPGPDVEDVVQDASLAAIVSLYRLREPELVRPWLTGITRNLCRERARASDDVPADTSVVVALSAGPEEVLERVALREWVWLALDGLSPPLREVVVLRYFSAASSYASMAAALGVPVGTVRSRLSDARRVLAASLRDLEGATPGDHEDLERERTSLVAGIVEEYNRGAALSVLSEALSPDAQLTAAGSADVLVGRATILRGLREDTEVGMRLRLLNVIAGRNITVVEGAFVNPPEHPDHCPPLTTQVMSHRGAGIAALHLHYSGA